MNHESARNPTDSGTDTPAHWTPVRRAVVFTGVFLATLLAGRIALLTMHAGDFAPLGVGDFATAFLHGVRFDLSITFGLIGLPLFVMTLPFAWARRGLVQQVCGWVCWAAFVALTFLLLADLVYYDFVHRHVGPEIVIATQDLDQNIQLVLQEHRAALLLLIVAAGAAFFAWRRMLRGLPGAAPPSHPEHGRPRRLATAAVAGILVVSLARGSPPAVDRLEVENAYDGVPPAGAQLVLTGPFNVVQFLLRTRDIWSLDDVVWEDALAIAQRAYVSDEETVDDPEFPFARHRAGPSTERRPNVVVVLLEGWSASEVDVLREGMGRRKIGTTPRFDELSREGVLLTRHYACGQRTRNGVAAVIAGLPSIPGMPYLGEGLEAMSIAYLGAMAADEGYSTYFIQGVQADSQRQNEIARWAGFEHFTSSEDIPASGAIPSDVDVGSRAWDHDLFDEALRQIADAPRPFLAFVQTADTHEPYLWPNDEWRLFPGGSRKARYRNAMLYGDWALGRFFDGARRDGWLDDTVVVIVSDHTQRRMEGDLDPPSLFHVPCLVLAPGLEPAVVDRVCGQTDVIPTIAELAGWTTPNASFGRSVLDGSIDDTRGAMCAHGELLLRIEKSGWVTRTANRRVDAGVSEHDADVEAIERRMIAIAEVYSVLMLRDDVMPPR